MTDVASPRIAARAGQAARTLTVRAPFDGQVLGTVPDCDRSHVDEAVATGRRALQADVLPTWRRASILDRAASRLAEPSIAEDFARTIALEAAKPIRTARIEVARAASTFAFSAAAARTVAGDVPPLDASQSGDGKVGFQLRVPVGVIGAITPFNFPLNLVVHKVGPAIAAGCPVVLKPAPQTPLTALKLADMLIDDCGLPAEWLGTVTGAGAELGAALVDHPDVAMITFTGSPQVGWAIRQAAPRKKVALELGNNAPVIVHDDGDVATAAERIAFGAFGHAGQSCVSVQRVFVHRAIKEEFLAALVAQTERLVVGDPLAEETDVSSQIDSASRDRVASWVDEAVSEGAQLASGGRVDKTSQVLVPTVLTHVQPSMRVCHDEVFGPVVAVAVYDDVSEAFRRANETRYGLQAGVFTTSLPLALEAVRTLDYGTVIVNDVPTWRADQMPYGGLRDSGNTKEGPMYSLLEMTDMRVAVLA